MSENTDGRELALVMPFVVCKSQGGPYDDEAFVAGYECGRLDGELSWAGDLIHGGVVPVHSASVPQIDLIAMRHGYTTTTEATEIDGWSTVTFTKDGTDG